VVTRLGAIGLAVWRGRIGQPMVQPHRHDDLEVNFSLDAEVVYRFAGRKIRFPPGRLAVFWAAHPHHKISSADSRAYWITIPLARFLRWPLPAEFIRTLLAGRVAIDRHEDAMDPDRLDRWIEDMHTRDDELREIAVDEIAARMRRLARRCEWASGQAAGDAQADHLAVMTAYLADHFTESITLTDVARAAGLNPRYAATLFREKLGRTIGQELTQHRVAMAQRLLARTDQPILSIGHASGFGSTSRFYEAFKAQVGQTPRRYRWSMRH